ncbi:uncharacterized mitochondrial protein AtMg00810-like [Cornus florida]|uniref:uncharacterized mitochondrial protein AtMg00810-like n=1 Tax=Cornus florida TaxID=4283 RepID=UPI00289BAF01|nr:uncharacterized mitochondrial protein AtMg00810-like [Cornus florida]
MEQNLKLIPTDGALLNDPTKYRRLVRRLIYLTITRPDIVYPVQTLSQFMHEPRKPHWDAAIRILKYIKGTTGQGLLFSSTNSLTLKLFVIEIGEDVVPQGGQLQDIVFSLEILSSHGNPRNKQMFLDHQQKPNIELWLTYVWS